MGLDQYLYAKNFTSKVSDANKYDRIIESLEAGDFSQLCQFPYASVSLAVGYWRKQNAIHHWFVINCQDGEDDCRESYVSREQLEELREICQKVLADNSLADELLPTLPGFFFGSTEYDEWYFSGLTYTVSLIDNLLESIPSGWDFAYGSSW